MSTPNPRTLLSYFIEHAASAPEAVALVHGDRRVTYAEADRVVQTLGAALIRAGALPDVPIGLCLERSPELIMGVLAILRSGAGYLPIDPAYPADRIGAMLEDARPGLVITDRAHAHLFQPTGARVLLLEELLQQAASLTPTADRHGPATPDHLAYVIFTSGSTGRPKGVAMPHAPVVNMIDWQTRNSCLVAGDRKLQFAPIGFDVSVLEIFGTLAFGGTLVLLDEADRLSTSALLRILRDHQVDRMILPYVTLQYVAEAVERITTQGGDRSLVPTSLKEVFFGGEQLKITPAIRHLFQQLPHCRFHNQYGPTECAVFVTDLQLPDDPEQWPALPSMGHVIDGVELHVLDDLLMPVPEGHEGELCIGGACLARGYINRPDLTAERFVTPPGTSSGRLYRTGDRVVRQPNGEIEFRGRADGQVKVRGFRIELGEIEVAMEKLPAVEQAVVMVREDRPGIKRLVGYYTAGQPLGAAELRPHLARSLPAHMVPDAFVQLEAPPLTPNGKIDHKALPAPHVQRPDLAVTYAAPRTSGEKDLAAAWADLLDIDRVGIDDNFFDLGGNSLLAIRTVAHLEELGLELPIVKLYQHPTVRACAAFLAGDDTLAPAAWARERLQQRSHGQRRQVMAIIGMSGRFPGADDVSELWKNLLAAKNGITTWGPDELDPSIPEALRHDPDYVRARGVINDADKFDAQFFGVTPRLAQVMDPQQRVMLEVAWAALEDAAYDPDQVKGMIGVYAGMNNNTYYTRNVLGHADLLAQVGDTQVSTSNEKDYIATRLAFEFGLRGPAISIHTACSTSLVAVAQACRALEHGDCDMALAGGVSVTAPIQSGVLFVEGSMYSPDGRTRTFDAAGQGTTFSDGAAMLVLKRLDDAVRDGDHIYATIHGAALNNDGHDKASFTAPSVRGQAEVIAMAQADADITPDRIGYVETHGTATPLGDPIEVEALQLAFRSDQVKRDSCAIGSIKSNVGHLTAAAGAAGVIKTALALQEGVIPPTIGFERLNPAIDLEQGPFHVAAKAVAWPRTDVPRFAGVSSFGVGGTNAHVILGEAPLRAPSGPSRVKQLLLISAKSKSSLDEQTERIARWLEEHPEAPLADVAHTLRTGRRHFRHRRAIVAGTHAEAITAIRAKDPAAISTREFDTAAAGTVFMFPGQGSQYVGMGRDLHAREPLFRAPFERCFQLFREALGVDLQAIILADPNDPKAAELLKRTEYTQPALFTIHYSLAQLWMGWGVRPDAMLGHSIGEFAAACLAGVFSLEDAVRLVAARGRLMQALPEGSMLSIRAAEADVLPKLPADCSIAANNGPQLCVASGPHGSIASLQRILEAEGIVCKALVTSHAFHSPMMDPIVEPFRQLVESVELHAPRIPIISTVTAEWLKDEEATSATYWSKHLRATVRFAQAVKFAWSDADRVMLEVGPRTTASTLARQQSNDPRKQVAVASLADSSGADAELASVLKAVGGLWQSGVPIDDRAFLGDERRLRIPLPTYAFERVRHWLEPVAMQPAAGNGTEVAPPASEAGQQDERSPKERLIADIKKLLEASSGLELAHATTEETFLEMGLDSLFLTQVATSLTQKFGVKISFRQLNEEVPNLDKLADLILPHLKDGVAAAVQQQAAVQQVPANALEDAPDLKKTFGAQARIAKEKLELTDEQRAWIADVTRRYNEKTAKSKAFNEANRAHMADPRVVTGFKPQIKETIYQVVVERSRGCTLWDIDGNSYIDMLNGFGSSMFGYMPDFIREACHAQLDTATDIGPMNPLAADVTRLMCEFTGHDRAALCNTGSEAVLGALRMARTVTGRSLVICFSGSYHGINDEVIIRGSKSRKSYPGAAGIMPEAVQNMLVLDYGTPESLEIIRQRCHEAAAVIVEPVQSRRMEFRPVDFLREVRSITEQHGTAFIFDEVITGFRLHPGGCQALFGIRADIATYGKVFGGGMPVGAMTGKSEWMDALDGGPWRFGDDSVPEVGVTYFAGTFVRHPLTLAACKASLDYMKQEGPALQEVLNARCDEFARRSNEIFARLQVPFYMVNFGSAMKLKYDEGLQWSDLYFVLLRMNGVHTLDGFPNFLTIFHTPEVLEQVLDAMERAMTEFKRSGLVPDQSYVIETQNGSLNGHAARPEDRIMKAGDAPVRGARLGRTPDGDAAWFVPDPDREGKFVMFVPE